MATDLPAARPRRRYLRFSLRTLFILVAVVGLWLGLTFSSGRRQKLAMESLQKSAGMGVHFTYDWQRGQSGDKDFKPMGEPPAWQRKLGIDYFHSIVEIQGLPRTDEGLDSLRAFARLERLAFADGKASADAWRNLRALGHLKQLQLCPAPQTAIEEIAKIKTLVDLALIVEANASTESVQGLARLPNLQSLSLSFQPAFGDDRVAECLRPLNGLSQLEVVALAFSGDSALTALEDWHDMHGLEHVIIRDSFELTTKGLAPLVNLPALKHLSLGDSPGVTIAGIKELHSLETLSIADSARKSTASLQDLAPLGRLKYVWYSHTNSLSGFNNKRAEFINFASMGKDWLHDRNVPEGDSPENSAAFGNLRKIDLFLVSQIDPNDFRGMSQLEALSMSCGHRLLDVDEPTSLGLANLRSLQIANIDSISLNMLKSAPRLEHLQVNDCHKVGPGDLASLAGNTSLRSLQLMNNPMMTDQVLTYVGQIPHLKSLEISQFPIDDGLERLAPLTELESLAITNCDTKSSGSLVPLAHLANLRSLSIGFVRTVDFSKFPVLREVEKLHFEAVTLGDADLARIVAAPRLVQLELKRTELSDTALAALASRPNLKQLDLSGNAKLTDAAVDHLKGLTQLEKLVVPLPLSASAVAALEAALPNCEVTQEQPHPFGGMF